MFHFTSWLNCCRVLADLHGHITPKYSNQWNIDPNKNLQAHINLFTMEILLSGIIPDRNIQITVEICTSGVPIILSGMWKKNQALVRLNIHGSHPLLVCEVIKRVVVTCKSIETNQSCQIKLHPYTAALTCVNRNKTCNCGTNAATSIATTTTNVPIHVQPRHR